MSGSLVPDLGLMPEAWLFLSWLGVVTIYFKFNRFWSLRNLDLLLLFVLAPGILWLVPKDASPRWWGYLGLFAGSLCLLARCLLDLGLSRRPLLEPNLNATGLGCLAVGVAGLLLAETVNLPIDKGAERNPADSPSRTIQTSPKTSPSTEAVSQILRHAALPLSPELQRSPPQDILARILAGISHLMLVVSLIAIGRKHFERISLGLAVATCYLILPYTRVAIVDTGQLVAAALVTAAIWGHTRPVLSGLLIGLAGGWMPACVGLVPLWFGFYRGRGARGFAIASVTVILGCVLIGRSVPELAEWARALGARSPAEAGFGPAEPMPWLESFWTGVEPVYRWPVLIVYVALVAVVTFWPAGKDLGELISLSAALLIASQFWYLDRGGTLVVLYLPLLLLMMFRPNLRARILKARRARVPTDAVAYSKA